jgi:hypothetical protein
VKIGKPTRFRSGSKSSHVGDREAERALRESMKVPATGPVDLYLDDERRAPKGSTLVRDSKSLLDMVATAGIADRVVSISLDWHLGADEMNGEQVAAALTEILKDGEALPALRLILCHSSNPLKARSMIDALREVCDLRDVDVG